MQTTLTFNNKEYITDTNMEMFDEIEKQVISGKLQIRTNNTREIKSVDHSNCKKYIQTYLDQDLNELYQVIKYVSIEKGFTVYDELDVIKNLKTPQLSEPFPLTNGT